PATLRMKSVSQLENAHTLTPVRLVQTEAQRAIFVRMRNDVDIADGSLRISEKMIKKVAKVPDRRHKRCVRQLRLIVTHRRRVKLIWVVGAILAHDEHEIRPPRLW